jgi:hypothetical protein
MRSCLHETCFDIGLLASPLCTRWALALGVGLFLLNRLMRLRFCETCIDIGLLASPLCGAAVTFFAAAKKVTKESSYGVSGIRT